MVKQEIDYKSVVESNVLVLKTNETVRVEFLDNGYTEEITLPSNQIVEQWTYQIKDLNDSNKEKQISFIQNRAFMKLKEIAPMKNKKFSIRKFSFGNTEYDIDFEINPI